MFDLSVPRFPRPSTAVAYLCSLILMRPWLQRRRHKGKFSNTLTLVLVLSTVKDKEFLSEHYLS